MFEFDGVARNVVSALAEEKPDEQENRTAEGEESDLYRGGPRGGEENESVGDAEGDSVKIAAGEDDFFGEREIAVGEGVFSAVVGVAEEFAVDEKFDSATDESVENDDNEAGDEIDLKSEEGDLGGGEENVGNHVKLDGKAAVFRGFILRKRPFTGAGAVKSVGELGDEENNEGIFGGRAGKSQN